MTLSILTTITNPDKRMDPWKEALDCYTDLADEVVVVNGGDSLQYDFLGDKKDKIIEVMLPWPYEWSWEELPHHLNAGLERTSSDWVIRCDIDYMFHEDDFSAIKSVLEESSLLQGVSFQKFGMTTIHRAFEKGPVTIAVNKGLLGTTLKFGRDVRKFTDLCFPIVWNGGMEDGGVCVGLGLSDVFKSGIRVWNYDATFRTKGVQRKEYHRFSRAYEKYFGEYKYGKSEEDSFQQFLDAMSYREKSASYSLYTSDHPKYIQNKLRSMTVEQFGYSMWL